MGKAYDPRTVEYAYVNHVKVYPNNQTNAVEEGEGEEKHFVYTYKHRVFITYELKDAAKKLIGSTEVAHEVASTGADSIATYTTAVAAALPGFVTTDKNNLAGYTP